MVEYLCYPELQHKSLHRVCRCLCQSDLFNSSPCMIIIIIAPTEQPLLMLQSVGCIFLWLFVNRDFLSYFVNVLLQKNLWEPPNVIIPFPLGGSKSSGPILCSSLLSDSSVPRGCFFFFLPSPHRFSSDTFSFSLFPQIPLKIPTPAPGADQKEQLMHFLCSSYLHIDWVFISVHLKAQSL